VKERRKTTCAMAWVVFFVDDGKKWGRDVKNMEEILRNLFLEDLDCFQ